MEFGKRDLITNTLPSRLLLNVLSDGISARLRLFKEAHFAKTRFFSSPKKESVFAQMFYLLEVSDQVCLNISTLSQMFLRYCKIL